MICKQWRHILLEAEPAELRGQGETEFAKHVRTCPRCHALAGQVLDDLNALSTALETQRSSVSAGAAVAGAAREAAHRQKRTKRWRAAIPALAAASLVGLLITQRTTREVTVQPLPDERHLAGFIPDVETPDDRDYMVIGTDNSKIVIIWFF